MENYSHWEKIAQTGLSGGQIESLIEACRLAHNEFISVGLACGIRAVFRVLGELGADRTAHELERVEIKANTCAGLAFIIIGCLSPLKEGQMQFELYMPADWSLVAYGKGQKLEIKMLDRKFNGADEVFAAPDAELFASVEKSACAF